jgi:hypothetical protein
MAMRQARAAAPKVKAMRQAWAAAPEAKAMP